MPQYFISVSHSDANVAARLLLDLHNQRIKADYNLSLEAVEVLSFAKTQVEAALQAEGRLEQFRRDCLADPQLLQSLRDAVARVKSIHKA